MTDKDPGPIDSTQRYECTISMTYDADGFIDAVRQFIANVFDRSSTWTVRVERLHDGEVQSIDTTDVRNN